MSIAATESRLLKFDMAGNAWAVLAHDFMDNPIFVPLKYLNGALDGDMVIISIKQREDGKCYAKVVKNLSRDNSAPTAPQHSTFVPSNSNLGPSYVSQPSYSNANLHNGYSYAPNNQLSNSVQAPQPQAGSLKGNYNYYQPNQNIVYNSSSLPQQVYSPPAKLFVVPPTQVYTPSAASVPVNPPITPQQNTPVIPPYGYPPNYVHTSQASSVSSIPSTPISGGVYYPPLANNTHSSPNPISKPYISTNTANGSQMMPNSYAQGPQQTAPNKSAPLPPRSSSYTTLPHITLSNSPASISTPKLASQQKPPPLQAPVYEGTLTIDVQSSEGYVVPHESSNIITVPREFLGGGKIGDIVRVQVIPPRCTADKTVGAVLSIIGQHPIFNSESFEENPVLPMPSYPDIDKWTSETIPNPTSFDSGATAYQHPPTSTTSSSFSSTSTATNANNKQITTNTQQPPTNPPASNVPKLPSRNTMLLEDFVLLSTSSKTAPNTTIPPQFVVQLKIQYSEWAKQSPPVMTFRDFSAALDLFGEVYGFSRSIFNAAHILTDWNQESISFGDFHLLTQMWLFGDAASRAKLAFRMLETQKAGIITKDQIKIFVEDIFKLLVNLYLPFYLTSSSEVTDKIWQVLDPQNVGFLNESSFCQVVQSVSPQFVGLGLASMPSIAATPLPKRGIPTYPGNPSWPIGLQMMVGISRSIKASAQLPCDTLTPDSFRQTGSFELHTTLKTNHKLIFVDHCPVVFKAIRKLRNIDCDQYLYSLGIEQLIGNLLCGKLTSLAKELSTGKSGQFFFTSHDGRFLLKTISASERYTLCKILPQYYSHLKSNPDSLLVPIYGLHEIGQLSVIVMGNIFNAPYVMNGCWDLKGSVIGRSSPNSTVKKDLDFDKGFQFGMAANLEFAKQIKADAAFLKSMNLVDYSMLAGYHSLSTEEMSAWEKSGKNPENSSHLYFDRGLLSYDSNSKPKGEIWFVGIIDFLVQYGYMKKAETWLKSLVHEQRQISIIPPGEYSDRFVNFLTSCIK